MIWRWLIVGALAAEPNLNCFEFTQMGANQFGDVGAASALPRNEPTKLVFEKKSMPIKYFDIDSDKGVSYLAPALVDTCRVTVKDGKLYDDRGALLQRGPDTIFVMDMEGALLVYNPRSLGKLIIQHSSFTAGKGVAAAGRMEVVDGVIQWADAKSGHYHPEKLHMNQLRDRLKELDYELPLDRLFLLHGGPSLKPD